MIDRTKTKLYKFAFIKKWFDAGYGATSVIKYAVGALGMTQSIIAQNIRVLVIYGAAYFVFCFILGWIMYNVPSRTHNYMLSEQEVNNQFDFFAREVRAKLKNRKI